MSELLRRGYGYGRYSMVIGEVTMERQRGARGGFPWMNNIGCARVWSPGCYACSDQPLGGGDHPRQGDLQGSKGLGDRRLMVCQRKTSKEDLVGRFVYLTVAIRARHQMLDDKIAPEHSRHLRG